MEANRQKQSNQFEADSLQPLNFKLGSLMKDFPTMQKTRDLVADIEAGTVICKGKMKGTIVASQKIEMHPSSKIVGNVQTPALNIELGAVLDGSCDMTGKEGKKIIKLLKEEQKEKTALT